jgi:hypothetical protein
MDGLAWHSSGTSLFDSTCSVFYFYPTNMLNAHRIHTLDVNSLLDHEDIDPDSEAKFEVQEEIDAEICSCGHILLVVAMVLYALNHRTTLFRGDYTLLSSECEC